MIHSRRFYENLPTYARLVDEVGTLAHFANRVAQPLFDTFERKLALLELIYNPDTCPEQWLDFLGQYIGAGPIGDRWLGLGMNPGWDANRKRNFINNFWAYRRTRGSEAGTREAIALWLGWEPARDKSPLPIVLPAGKILSEDPPLLWTYLDPYESDLILATEESLHWGTIEPIGDRYQPNYFTLDIDIPFSYEDLWWDGAVDQVPAPELDNVLSSLGHHCPWFHFHVKAEEWNQINPDIHALNQEILSVRARPEIFTWLIPENAIAPFELEEAKEVREQRTITQYFLDGLKWGSGQNWDAIAGLDPALDYHYAADLWPALFGENITETKTVTTEIDYGIWLPDEWDTMQWGEAATFDQIGQQTFIAETSSDAIAPLDLASIAAITTLQIDVVSLIAVVSVWTHPYYSPWDTYVLSKQEVVTPIEASCDFGANFTAVSFGVPEYDAIALPLGIGGQTNQYLQEVTADDGTKTRQLLEPITIAEYDAVQYEQQYPYFYNELPNPTSVLNFPVETLEIESGAIASINLNQIAPLGRVNAIACNVPNFWTTLTAEQYITYEQETEEDARSLLDIYPKLNTVLDGDNWQLSVVTGNELYLLPSTTIFWFKGNGIEVLPANIPIPMRSRTFSIEKGFTNLYLEFLFQPKISTLIYSASLILKDIEKDIYIKYQDFHEPLNAGDRGYYGFTFTIPFEVKSNILSSV